MTIYKYYCIVKTPQGGDTVSRQKDLEKSVNPEKENVKLRRKIRMLERRIGELEQLAYRDPLTGVYNFRMMEEALAKESARSLREEGEFCVMVFDVDDLKIVNNTKGHNAGNTLLVTVAATVQRLIREEDTFCRMGGDEFMLILPHMQVQALTMLETRLKAALALSGVRISVGAASSTESVDVQQLVDLADQRMYAEKAEHKAANPT